ncbi:MAG: hypothetical protein JNL66_10340 [Alphaproteobacteria bacterium]|nr:hypothetical protein [Alphaproteobacteria bacterium]
MSRIPLIANAACEAAIEPPIGLTGRWRWTLLHRGMEIGHGQATSEAAALADAEAMAGSETPLRLAAARLLP